MPASRRRVLLLTISAGLVMAGFGAPSPPLSAAQAAIAATPIDAFALPAKTLFDRAMPRYPNVRFHVDAGLASSHRAAVALVTDALRDSMRLREYFRPSTTPKAVTSRRSQQLC